MKWQKSQEWLAKCTVVWLVWFVIWGQSANAQEIVWEQANGPYGGFISSLFATPEGTLYAGTSGGVFRSEDGGGFWAHTRSTNFDVSALAILGKTLYAGTQGGGVFRSTDGGNSWTRVGLTHLFVSTLAVVGNTLYAGTFGDGVFRSTDSGDSWTPVNAGLTTPLNIRTLVVRGTTLYVAMAGNGALGVFRLADGGNSWEGAGLTAQEVWSLSVLGDTLYASTQSGVFCSADGGDSWTRTGLEPCRKWGDPSQEFFGQECSCVNSFAILGTTLYAGTGVGIFRSMDDGDSWTLIDTGMTDSDVESLAVLGTTIYAGTFSGVFRSADGGDSWMPVNIGLTNSSVTSLALSGSTLYAGTYFNGVFRSEDGGDSWVPVNAGLTKQFGAGIPDVQSLAVLGTTLYAGTDSSGVFRSNDGGNSWTHVGLSCCVQTLAISGTTLYVGVEVIDHPGLGDLYRSDDGGNSWTPTGFGATHALAVSETTLYDAAVWPPEVRRSSDGGNSWVQAGLTEVTGVTSLAVLGTTLYAGTYTCTETFDGAFACPGSVFRSEDNGDSWTEANIELGDSIVTTFLISGGILYLGASGRGVFQSKDNGKSWTEANTGLTNLFISSLAVLGDTLYAGTGGSGVFRARLPSHNHKVAVQPRGKMPFTLGAIKETALLQNYPNPFNPETWMPFVLHEATEVEIRIYNVPGQLVRTLQLGRKAPGIYLNKAQAAYWDGTNDDGEAVGSGIYFYQMHAGSNTFVRKAVLLK